MSIADGDDEDLMGLENVQFGQSPPLTSLKVMLFKWHGETHVQFTELPTGKQCIFPRGIPYITQHVMHDRRNHWRNQGFSALHYQQKPFENAAPYHLNGVAYEEVRIAAALATSRTAAQMTSRSETLRIMLDRNSVSNREDSCPKLFPSQLRHSNLSDTL